MQSFDPFTATLEEAEGQPDAYDTRGAVWRWAGALDLMGGRAFYEVWEAFDARRDEKVAVAADIAESARDIGVKSTKAQRICCEAARTLEGRSLRQGASCRDRCAIAPQACVNHMPAAAAAITASNASRALSLIFRRRCSRRSRTRSIARLGMSKVECSLIAHGVGAVYCEAMPEGPKLVVRKSVGRSSAGSAS